MTDTTTRTAGLEPSEAEHLHREIVALRGELAQLRADLATEIRTERLTVVHPHDGRELLHTLTNDGMFSLRLNWSADDGAPGIELQACEDGEHDGCGESSIALVGNGDVMANLSAYRQLVPAQYGRRDRYTTTSGIGLYSNDYEDTESTHCESTRLDLAPKGIELHAGPIVARPRFEVTQ